MTAMVVEHQEAERFTAEARELVEFFAGLADSFTADDLHDAGLPKEPHGNLLNAVLRTAARDGLIRKTGVTESRRKERKGGYTAVWTGTQNTQAVR